LIFVIASLVSSAALAQVYISKPTAGTDGMISTPIMVNLYWDTNHGAWNAHVAPSPGSLGDGSPTIARIDAMTQALAHSSYLSGLAEYGVSSWTLGPSLVLGEVSGCPLSLATPPANTQLAYNALSQVASCIQPALAALNGDNVVLTIFYPPQVVAGGDHGFCGTSVAYHEDGPSYIRAVSFVPLVCNPAKNGLSMLGQTMNSYTHELVESITDPITPFGYRNLIIPIGPWNGEEVADVCQGGSNGPLGELPSANFLKTTLGTPAALSTFWSNNQSTCISGVSSSAPLPYVSNGHDLSLSFCGRGENMQITLNYWQPYGFPQRMVPWDLANGEGASTLFLNATVASNTYSWGAGDLLRWPTPDTIGFKNIEFNVDDCPQGSNSCRMDAEIFGFNQDVVMAAKDNISVTVTDPGSGLEMTETKAAPSAAQATFIVSPPANSPNLWTFFGDTTQVHGQIQDSCSIYDPRTHINSGPGPIENEPVTGIVQASWPVTDLVGKAFNGGFSDPQGGYQFQLVTDTAGLQTITFSFGASTNVVVHPVVNTVSVVQDTSIVITGAGFPPAPRTTAQIDGVVNVTNVWVSPDGTELSFTIPSGYAGGTRSLLIFADGVQSLPQTYYICEPITSCALSLSCNTTINDGCNTVQCGACTNGNACNAAHNCCPSGQEPDGTGGCECAPHRLCPKGTDWDPNLCYCARPI
jgi:hypothetical protein